MSQLLRHFDVLRNELFEELRNIPGAPLEPDVEDAAPLREVPPLTVNAQDAFDAASALAEDPNALLELCHLFGGVLQITQSSGYRALEHVLKPAVALEEIWASYEKYLHSDLSYGDFLQTQFPRALPRRADNVPTHSDRPSTRDELGRDIFAEVLASRLRKVREPWPERRARDWPARTFERLRRMLRGERPEEPVGPSGCFILHLDGRWGSGKSSLLNFVENELAFPSREENGKAPTRWVVVRFNAWEHQRIAPPWWWLMTAIYREGVRGLWRIGRRRRAIMLGSLNLLWRLRDGWAAYILLPAAAFLVWLLLHSNFFGLQAAAKHGHQLDALLSVLKSLGAIGGFAVAVWGGVRGVNRWLLVGSAQGAATLLPRTRDPMKVLKRRHAQLVQAIGLPIVVFIDDLDRCKADYVVELLEGIQTLFAEQPITYIIAADRHWVSDSFTQVYQPYEGVANEPGRPLGYLFLEKTFQLVLPVPRLAESARDGYWRRLIGDGTVAAGADGGSAQTTAEATKAREDAERHFASLATEQEVLQELHAATAEASAVEVHERLRAALLRLEDSDIEKQTGHTLERFAPLLEDNPRAMKRLVNAYGIERHLAVMRATREGEVLREDDLQRLALRAILRLRWPLLAEYVDEHAGVLAFVNGGVPEDSSLPVEVERLLAEQAVKDVVSGKNLDVDILPEPAPPPPSASS